MKIYTRDGDDGTTGLYFGGRINKNSEQIDVNGAVDEAQASLGWARSLSAPHSRLNDLLITVERDLWVLMAEVATSPENRRKLAPNKSLVTPEMITRLEDEIDALSEGIEIPKEFIVPGENQLAASLDVARTVVRRAERLAVGYQLADSLVVAYLNRLSDLVWTMARFAEGKEHRTVKTEL
ncbi:MAG TPA: cob(I)yrinic acid a,c-diamide adenosyltransferase [Acidimicrobiales bacterium]|nr:cob(I)yrinic acid a,c-diamide adenosyltransferase [Acidimicrobiales bacterium]